ncbi:hypothetical protein [Arthrobacter pityocampae]|uniref:hypothetical protein n=1 Tax=Arthrobacter pityocampae TaxID=547334 RepID=UPI003734D6F0
MTAVTTESRRLQPTTLNGSNSYDSLDSSLDLTREQADLVLRNTTDAYYNTHGRDNGPRLEDFQRRLSWMIGGTVPLAYLEDILTAWDGIADVNAGSRPHDDLDAYEELLNCSVNNGLAEAGIKGKWINRDEVNR